MKKEFTEKRTVIIFTGGPGTGKSGTMQRFLTYLDNDDNIMISYDQIKEKNWDEFGFDNLQQKDRLNWWSLEEFYLTIQKNMWENRTIFIEYPFYQRHKAELERLVQ
jgi:uridine kinase